HHQRQRETPDGHAFKSTTGGVRPNPRENGQISPSTTVRASRGADNRRHLASVLRQGRKTRILTPVWESSGESRLKDLLHPMAVPTAGTRYRLRRDFQDDEALGRKGLQFARRGMTERDRLPLREVHLGITECQHLAWVDDVTLTIAVAELGAHLGVQRFGVQ